jgi:hypothetical protein
MDITAFSMAPFCLIDDQFTGKRQRGPQPILAIFFCIQEGVSSLCFSKLITV